MNNLRIIELFGGIGACTQALKQLNIPIEVVDYVEIDKYAVASYNAINGTNFEPQDITTWDKDLKSIDLIMHGSPCQDFSIAGKQAGGDANSGTRSSLMYETIRIVSKIKPNRERVFTISILNGQDFKFPLKQELQLRLKDVLEDTVDEKYYLNDKQIERIKTTTYHVGQTRIQEKDYCDTLCARDWKDPKCVRVGGIFDTEKSKHQAGSVYDEEGLAPTLDTMQGGWRQPCVEINDKTICLNSKGGRNGVEGLQPSLKDRVYDSNGISTCIATSNFFMPNYTDKLRIRKLTPKECWRLMGFSDTAFEKAEKVNSNTQLYKQAGNSIVVNVLTEIFKKLFAH